MIKLAPFALARVAGFALILCVLGGLDAAAQSSACLRATLDWEFALPDGSMHAPGAIRVCLERNLSPVSGLHKIQTGSQTAGLFRSRSGRAEEDPGEEPGWLVFSDVPGRPPLFIGYSVRWRDRMLVYWLDAPEMKTFDDLPPSSPEIQAREDVLVVSADAL